MAKQKTANVGTVTKAQAAAALVKAAKAQEETTVSEAVSNEVKKEEIVPGAGPLLSGFKPQDAAEEDGVSEAEKLFGTEKFKEACKLAGEVLGVVHDTSVEIRKLEGEIALKREGNSAKLHRLSKLCVELTATRAEDGTLIADLEKASILFRDSCKWAEDEFMVKWHAANPGKEEVQLRQIATSWPTLKANFAGALSKAGINPLDHVKPTDVVKAYTAWKSNPDNAHLVSQAGKPSNAATRAPRQPVGPNTAVPGNTTQAGGQAEKMSTKMRTVMRTLLGTIEGLTLDQQDIVADKLATVIIEANALMHEGATGSQVNERIEQLTQASVQ